jgi:ring-1,2-phenylacetyl-CoA epoxidase subunit PaaC
MNQDAIKDLLYRLADDELVIGHRMSEWTGLGPFLEEDIAFASIAQDEVGHAQAIYSMLHELLGEATPDVLAFQRNPEQFHSTLFVEQPNGDYAFSLIRHFLYDFAEDVRLEALVKSKFAPLAELAVKLSREERYHQLHAITWVSQLGNATEESHRRMQDAVNAAYPMALGLFEPTQWSDTLAAEGIMPHEKELQAAWSLRVEEHLTSAGLSIPAVSDPTAFYGGRSGKHSDHLSRMLKEMTEVTAIDPTAVW